MENPDPPSPQIKDGKMVRFCPSRGFILDLGGGWGFAVPFYFVQDCRFDYYTITVGEISEPAWHTAFPNNERHLQCLHYSVKGRIGSTRFLCIRFLLILEF